MYEDLNQKEMEILFFIKKIIETQGFSPTVREICKGVGLKSPSSVHGYLERLEAKGYIEKSAMKNRTVIIKNQDSDMMLAKKQTVDIPIIGRVAAGSPILASENIEDTFPIPTNLAENKDLFMLKVFGESMINIGILDGDYVLIEKRSTAKNGDIVLALIDDSATIKRFFKENGSFRLQPENDNMDPIITNDLEILGHVIGLYRDLM
ncbi:MAG: transcriptional repressor LexA [Tissierellia bacterium]|nr:transcriptional repressor LexA [Tissierellia bacterium]